MTFAIDEGWRPDTVAVMVCDFEVDPGRLDRLVRWQSVSADHDIRGTPIRTAEDGYVEAHAIRTRSPFLKARLAGGRLRLEFSAARRAGNPFNVDAPDDPPAMKQRIAEIETAFERHGISVDLESASIARLDLFKDLARDNIARFLAMLAQLMPTPRMWRHGRSVNVGFKSHHLVAYDKRREIRRTARAHGIVLPPLEPVTRVEERIKESGPIRKKLGVATVSDLFAPDTTVVACPPYATKFLEPFASANHTETRSLQDLVADTWQRHKGRGIPRALIAFGAQYLSSWGYSLMDVLASAGVPRVNRKNFAETYVDELATVSDGGYGSGQAAARLLQELRDPERYAYSDAVLDPFAPEE